MRWIQVCEGCVSRFEQIDYLRGKLTFYKTENGNNNEELNPLKINGALPRVLEHSNSFLERALSGGFSVPRAKPRKRYEFAKSYLSLIGKDKIAANLAYALAHENPFYFFPDHDSEFSPISKENLEAFADELGFFSENEKSLTREREVEVFKSFNFYKKNLIETAKEILNFPKQKPSCELIFQLADSYNNLTLFEHFLVMANRSLSAIIARRMTSDFSRLSAKDFEGNAILRLIPVIHYFDYTLGYKFSTYASRAIRSWIRRGIASEVPAVYHLSTEDIDMGRHFYNLPDDDSSEEIALLKSTIKNNVLGLEDREILILKRRFGFDDGEQRTLEVIGRELGVTKERVRQIEKRTISKIRVALKDKFP